MPHVDDTVDTLSEDFWQEVPAATLPTPATPSTSQGWLAGLCSSLAASMALHRGRGWFAARRPVTLSPTDILAQNHPDLYIRIMMNS